MHVIGVDAMSRPSTRTEVARPPNVDVDWAAQESQAKELWAGWA